MFYVVVRVFVRHDEPVGGKSTGEDQIHWFYSYRSRGVRLGSSTTATQVRHGAYIKSTPRLKSLQLLYQSVSVGVLL